MTKSMITKSIKAAMKQNDFVMVGDIKDYTGYIMTTASKCYSWLIKYGYITKTFKEEALFCDIEKCQRYLDFNNAK